MIRLCRHTLLLVACVLLSGCVGAGSDKLWASKKFTQVWPDPPAEPRIELLRLVSAEELADKKRSDNKFLRWVTGEDAMERPLVAPYGVAADGDGKVWIADTAGRALHFFDLQRNKHEIWTVAGGISLLSPVGLAIDPDAGRLFVSDSVLRKVLVLGFDGRLQREVIHPEGFRRPVGLGLDAEGRLMVVDALRGTVERFTPAGQYLDSFGSGINPDGLFTLPSNVASDRQGNIMVTDSMNFRIEVFDRSGSSIGTIGSLGDVPGSFARPRGIAVDSEGHLYVADAAFGNIQVFDQAGQLLLYFGKPGKAPGQFSLPAGMFIDQNDRLYVVDSYNQRVQIFRYLADE